MSKSNSFPRSIGAAADALYGLQQVRLEKSREVDELKKREEALEEHILVNMLPALGLKGAKGEVGQVSIKENIQASVTDWDDLYAYISKKKAWQLIQKRVSITSLRELWDAGKGVPGVESVTINKLHVSKVPR